MQPSLQAASLARGRGLVAGRLLLTCLLLLSASALAQKKPVVLDRKALVPMGKHLEYLEDPGGKLTIQQASSAAMDGKFVASKLEIPSFGLTPSAYWFRFALRNPLPTSETRLLDITFPVLDRIDVYVEQPGGGWWSHTMGDTFPHGNKLIPHHHFVFPVTVAAGQQKRVYLRVQTRGAMQLPLRMWTQAGFRDNEHHTQLLFGVFFGVLLVMLFYNLFIFFVVRDRSYLHLVLFIASGLSVEATVIGVAQEMLWPFSPWFANRALPFGLYAASAFAVLFEREFLRTWEEHLRWDRVLRWLSRLFLACSLLSLVVSYHVMVVLLPIFAVLGVPVMIVVAVQAVRRGFHPARYYLVAWVVMFASVLLVAASRLRLVETTLLTDSAHFFGFALTTVLFSFALADRIDLLRKEKDRAQAEALEVQRQAAENLELEVQRKTQDLERRTRELEQAYEQLAEHDRLKSRFFANISHEVRTPLTLILTPLERMAGEESPAPPGVKERLRPIVGNTHRLLRLVNQFLDFSRLESGGTTVAYERMELRAFLDSVVGAFDTFARSKGIKLEVRGPEQVPEVYSDPNKLDKVLSNLLSNACKFTEPGGRVVVRLESDETRVRVAVKDTGIGIPEEDLPHIFERFRQVDGSSSRRYGGTGIGLALSRELVQLVGGTLELESELGVGSTFTLTLPLGQDHISDEAMIQQPSGAYEASQARDGAAALAAEIAVQPADAGAAPAPEEADDERPLLLVVEDNPEMRALVREICQAEFRVLEAANGKQGLELLQQHRPALVISDIMMPEMDGNELLERIRADAAISTTPVILLTAKAGPDSRLGGLETGADDYLVKPFESRELLARARNVVRLQQQERELRELTARLQAEVMTQSTELERVRTLGRYLSPAVARAVLEGGTPVQVGQRRCKVTLFRIELRGFDRVVEAVDPEDMTAMLNGYLSAMMELAFAHGATVDHVIQDAVGGFYGAPVSEGEQEDARRGVTMALEMGQRAVEVCEQWRPVLGDNVPIPTMVLTTGHATVGNFGSSSRLDYTAVGRPVNEVRMLLPKLPAGVVACTQSTHALLEEPQQGELLRLVELPHRTSALSVYRLASLTEEEAEATRSVAHVAEVSSTGPTSAERSPSTYSRRGGGISDEPAPGALLAGRYEVLEKLGAGGMGLVYKVRDLKLSTTVALKLLRSDMAEADPAAVKRLYREVRLARLVTHRNVARIYDVGEWKQHEFITMEYVVGEPLSRRIREAGALPLLEGRDVLLQVCDGLAAAHIAGIVHRDLKPSNIMLEHEGRVVIMDFGIARWGATASELTDSLTEGVSSPGTPLYMAPEQFTGTEVDQRADIYALGLVAYELFTGERVFGKADVATLGYMHVHKEPPSPRTVRPELPARLEAVIMRCLAKKPGDRFRTASEIRAILGGEGSAAGEEAS